MEYINDELKKICEDYPNVKIWNENPLIIAILGSGSNNLELNFKDKTFRISYDWGELISKKYKLSDFYNLKWKSKPLLMKSFMRRGEYLLNGKMIGNYGKDFDGKVKPVIIKLQENQLITRIIEENNLQLEKLELKEKEEKRLKEEQRLKELKVLQTNLLSELDKDGNGEVDVIEGNDFNVLLKKHQISITEIDRNYIQQFVKISSYLKTKKNNIQLIFNSIKDTPNEETLNQYVEILKDDIHSYNLILFNSLNMIVSLVEDDMITFYELHEMFDNLNIFDSKHEKDISQKLTNIGDGLKDLMYSIEEMGRNIENQMGELTYVTEQTNRVLDNQLQSINSSIKTNNLLTSINAYQTYKLRKGS